MTDFHVECVRLGPIEKHANADTLGITYVGAYPVIVRLGDYNEGDLAVYVPVDSVVPTTDPRWTFLEGKGRIKSKRLRGVFSQGLLTPATPDMNEGDDVAEKLGITKYLTNEEANELGNENGPNVVKKLHQCPSSLPRYTDIENLRRHPNTFAPGQQVIVTEKIEGECASYAYVRPTFWQKVKSWFGANIPCPVLCRSRNQMKYEGKWFNIIAKYDLESRFERLDDPEQYSIYGESYGYTSGFDYGTDRSGEFLVFDVYDRVMNDWLDFDDAYQVCQAMGLAMVPVLYRGAYDADTIANLAEGNSVLSSHIKEGVIVRSEYEQDGPSKGRNVVKLKGQGYLLRKEQ